MAKDDIFSIVRRSKGIYNELENGTFSKYESDNKIIKKYVDSKHQGNYRHIIYECNAPEKTVYKNLVVLKKIVKNLNKPFCELTEDDLVELQNKLNRNEILNSSRTKPIYQK